MVEFKTVTKELSEFNKILNDLVNIEVKIEDEDMYSCIKSKETMIKERDKNRKIRFFIN